MLELKNKIPPSPQILRLKEWFSRYNFSVKHIKGNQNVIPDFLSRPKSPTNHQNPLKEKTLSITIFSDTHEYPLIMMNEPSSSHQNLHEFPPELIRIQPITPTTIKSFAQTHMFHYLATTIQDHQIKPKPTWFNPSAPYLNIFPILMDKTFTETDMWYLWCVTTLFKYPIIFPTLRMIGYLAEDYTQDTLLWKFLSWFSPIIWWKEQIHREISKFNVWKLEKEEADQVVSIFTIHRPYFRHPNGHLYTQDQALSYVTFPNLKIFMNPKSPPFWKEELTIHLHEINGFKITQKPVSSSCNKLKNLDLICTPDWEVPPNVWNEKFEKVHLTELPPNNTLISESNLLWQDWQRDNPVSKEKTDYPADHIIWQDSQDPWPDSRTWAPWPTSSKEESAESE